MPLLSTSAKTGFSPKFNVQLADITNDLDETIISSPFFKFIAFNAISNATLPLLNATEYLFPKYNENSSSNFLHSMPVQ